MLQHSRSFFLPAPNANPSLLHAHAAQPPWWGRGIAWASRRLGRRGARGHGGASAEEGAAEGSGSRRGMEVTNTGSSRRAVAEPAKGSGLQADAVRRPLGGPAGADGFCCATGPGSRGGPLQPATRPGPWTQRPAASAGRSVAHGVARRPGPFHGRKWAGQADPPATASPSTLRSLLVAPPTSHTVKLTTRRREGAAAPPAAAPTFRECTTAQVPAFADLRNARSPARR